MKYKDFISLSLLVISFALGTFFRLYKLDQLPQGFNWDEAAVGYNAYLLSETGKDEFSRSWPLLIKSFGEYKTGIYSAMIVPIIRVLGLSIFSVRIFNAIIGSLMILIMYWLSKKIFKEKIWASIVSLLTATSPFLIHLSRFTLEWYMGIALVLIGIGLLIEVEKKIRLLPVTVITLSASLYFYHGLRLMLPLLGLAYFIKKREMLLKNFKISIVSLLLGIITLIPLMISMKNNPDWLARAKSVSIFGDVNYQREFDKEMFTSVYQDIPLIRIFNNKAVFFGKKISSSYLNHFSPEFLFEGIDATPRLGIDKVGKLYLITLVFLLVGLLEVLKTRRYFLSWLLLVLIGLSPLASSMTNDSPHGLRSVMLIPCLLIMTVIGLRSAFLSWLIKNHKVRVLFWLLVAMIFTLEVMYFQWQYWIIYRNRSAIAWQAGHQQMVNKVSRLYDDYDQIIITKYYGQPHIFYAFFSQFDSNKYQSEVMKNGGSFNASLSKLGKIQFRDIEDKDFCADKTLIVTHDPGRVPNNIIRKDKVVLDLGEVEKKTVFELIETTDNLLLNRRYCSQDTQ